MEKIKEKNLELDEEDPFSVSPEALSRIDDDLLLENTPITNIDLDNLKPPEYKPPDIKNDADQPYYFGVPLSPHELSKLDAVFIDGNLWVVPTLGEEETLVVMPDGTEILHKGLIENPKAALVIQMQRPKIQSKSTQVKKTTPKPKVTSSRTDEEDVERKAARQLYRKEVNSRGLKVKTISLPDIVDILKILEPKYSRSDFERFFNYEVQRTHYFEQKKMTEVLGERE